MNNVSYKVTITVIGCLFVLFLGYRSYIEYTKKVEQAEVKVSVVSSMKTLTDTHYGLVSMMPVVSHSTYDEISLENGEVLSFKDCSWRSPKGVNNGDTIIYKLDNYIVAIKKK